MEFCAHSSEGWGPQSPQRPFDLTPCFEWTVLFSIPSALLTTFGIRSIFKLRRRAIFIRGSTSRRLSSAKIVLALVLALLSVARFVFATLSPKPQSPAAYVSLLMQALAFLILPALTRHNDLRARRSSTLLLLFWPVYLTGYIIWARTAASINWIHRYQLDFTLASIITVLGLLHWVLECLGPEHGKDAYHVPNRDQNESRYETASVYSRWTFHWMDALMQLGSQKFLEEEDVYNLGQKDQSAVLGEKLEKATKKHLWVAMATAYGSPFFVAVGLKIIQDVLAFAQPQFLRWLLSYIAVYQAAVKANAETPDPVQGFAIVILMFIVALVQTIVLHQYFQRCYETGMRVRSGLVNLIYKKALVLSSEERGKKPTGDIVNLASVDAIRLQDLCTYGLIVFSGPFQIILAFISLYNLLGWSAFVGVAIMLISIPLNMFIGQILKRMQEKQMKVSDQRTRLMSELLNNIKSIKLYNWEGFFMSRILSVRNDQELKLLRQLGIMTSISTMIWQSIPLLVSFGSFVAAAYTYPKPLTSDIVFPAIALFLLLSFPLAMFAQITNSIVQAMVSVRRLSTFLQSGELQSNAVVYEPSNGKPIMEIKDGEFRWDAESTQPTLEGIDVGLGSGELVAVLGRVGSGKTSLLSAIAGEMLKSDGQVFVRGSVAYAPQNPWIMSATVRDNILFCHEFEQEYYDIVLDACALRPDLALLADGDMTEVGEKGINLSGGQRARIALARAVYARADLTLLDDVLAAVDNHVARHLFDHVIGPKGLLAGRARVVVTNGIAYLSQVDKLILMRGGVVLDSDSYPHAMSSNDSELYKFITASTRSSTTSRPPSGTATPVSRDETLVSVEGTQTLVSTRSPSSQTGTYKKATKGSVIVTAPELQRAKKEHRERGRVKPEVYKQYIAASSVLGFTILAIFVVLQQIMTIGSTYVLKSWAQHNQEVGRNTETGKYLALYGLAILASALLSFFGAVILLVWCTLRSARYLHDKVLGALLRSPLSFFDITPSGRILNVFSRDVYVVDQVLARVFSGFIRTGSMVVGTVVIVCVSFPLFTFALVPLAFFYRRVMIYYLATSRELKRLDAVSRAPIFTWFQETLGGLSTIRAFRHQDSFSTNLQKRLDDNQKCYMAGIDVNRWLAIRLELIGSLIILTTSTLALSKLIWWGGVDAGLVGMVLSYCLSVTGALNWLVRSASEVEQNIVSVERMITYAELPPEAPARNPETAPTQPWPNDGVIEFRNYSMRYRPELDFVLRNINLIVPRHAKVGIVGRTGAGKSSTLLALFRIIEPAAGAIYIDGVDITKIGLDDLRSVMSIIPQEPQLFQGTVRENIDPSSQYSDAALWDALEKSHLKEHISSIGGLEAEVQEGGSSLSAGQRQLLCFARALLRQTKIIVLDEATSAVDPLTDQAIQEIITGPEFHDVTMLTIAHRLNTVVDYDYILVLHAGEVAEFDSPQALLATKGSIFRSLAVEAKLTSD